ncbi:hypothetical protein DUNSADRAFT_2918 [Dunaliella salina]|uniref:Encoded protein n=1 Tax=Dunaliella salina TaxID=3046 RepID=A0ABQ7GUV5_DUNSA|nr:hypothetical protein DUNSADRAFT_2918 [Dunaliella salina]|eukprot:KAF5838382.1 hypothetical protein DUNSADRAFT_2918 [Dunaliella salina]
MKEDTKLRYGDQAGPVFALATNKTMIPCHSAVHGWVAYNFFKIQDQRRCFRSLFINSSLPRFFGHFLASAMLLPKASTAT